MSAMHSFPTHVLRNVDFQTQRLRTSSPRQHQASQTSPQGPRRHPKEAKGTRNILPHSRSSAQAAVMLCFQLIILRAPLGPGASVRSLGGVKLGIVMMSFGSITTVFVVGLIREWQMTLLLSAVMPLHDNSWEAHWSANVFIDTLRPKTIGYGIQSQMQNTDTDMNTDTEYRYGCRCGYRIRIRMPLRYGYGVARSLRRVCVWMTIWRRMCDEFHEMFGLSRLPKVDT